eukprot:6214841-Pleurochrysis_carterae.AAC.3
MPTPGAAVCISFSAYDRNPNPTSREQVVFPHSAPITCTFGFLELRQSPAYGTFQMRQSYSHKLFMLCLIGMMSCAP